MAHDFNNMLGVIIGYTDLVLGKLDPESELRADLLQVLEAAERSIALVRQLLTFSRKQEVSPEVVDLNGEIRANLKMLERIIGENIRTEFDEEPDLWPVLIDRMQLSQVLANLSANARDAIGAQGRVLIRTRNISVSEDTAKVSSSLPRGDWVVIEFSDTGCGMDQAVIHRIFDPFFSTKPPGEGTGLGLSTVYGIVQQHGGFIEVQSEIGKGSTFFIYLPRAEAPADNETRQAAAAVKETDSAGPESVLVVEDEPQVLNLTRTLLERLGYQVTACATPREALAALEDRERTFDLLIADLLMPDMDGMTLAAQVSALRPKIKTLFVSGYAADALPHLDKVADKATFLQKPFGLETLARKVREALDS